LLAITARISDHICKADRQLFVLVKHLRMRCPLTLQAEKLKIEKVFKKSEENQLI
jgi:hypothetical protein